MSEYAIPRGPRTPAWLAENTDGLLFRRWAACWIDLIVAAVAFFGAIFAVGAVAGVFGVTRSEDIGGMAILIGLAAPLLYYGLMEGTTGQTLGKMALGLQVVTNDGRVAAPWRIAVRTLLRLIEINPFLAGGLPAGFVALLNKRRRRIGDFAAGTYVVLKKDVRPVPDADKQAIVFE